MIMSNEYKTIMGLQIIELSAIKNTQAQPINRMNVGIE